MTVPRALNQAKPPPIIGEQAGIVVGDLKLVTGVEITMSVFQGARFPNASTPWTNNSTLKVPSFACSMPNKIGCLFNVSADPTEHHDLALERPDDAKALLERLRAVSKTQFDPDRGTSQPAACAQVRANGGFFGPWLP